jgi:hypothetical protein
VFEKFADACGHFDPCSLSGAAETPDKTCCDAIVPLVRERDITRGLPWSGSGKSRSARPAKKDKPFQFPADTLAGDPKKPAPSLL